LSPLKTNQANTTTLNSPRCGAQSSFETPSKTSSKMKQQNIENLDKILQIESYQKKQRHNSDMRFYKIRKR
jgi:hypothetical protein